MCQLVGKNFEEGWDKKLKTPEISYEKNTLIDVFLHGRDDIHSGQPNLVVDVFKSTDAIAMTLVSL